MNDLFIKKNEYNGLPLETDIVRVHQSVPNNKASNEDATALGKLMTKSRRGIIFISHLNESLSFCR